MTYDDPTHYEYYADGPVGKEGRSAMIENDGAGITAVDHLVEMVGSAK